MSTVTYTSPAPTPLDVAQAKALPAPARPSSAHATSAPAYFNLAKPRPSINVLGIAVPRTPEDATAILADVALLLEKTVEQMRNNRATAAAGNFRSALGVLGSTYQDMRTLKDRTAQLTQAKADKSQNLLVQSGLRAAMEVQNAAYGRDIIVLEGDIAALNQQIAELEAAGHGDATAGLVQHRDSKIAARDSVLAQQQQLGQAIAATDLLIGTLQTDIAAIDLELAAATASYNTLQTNALKIFVPLALAFAGRKASATIADAAYDQSLYKLFDALSENAIALSDSAKARQLSQNVRLDTTIEDQLTDSPVFQTLVFAMHQVMAALSDLATLGEAAASAADPAVRVRLPA